MNKKLEFSSITGPITGKEILFGVYRPQEYFEKPDRSFPVIYLLHGLNEDCTFHIETMAHHLEKAVKEGLIPPMLIVSPDGYTNSLWVDSFDMKKPAQTNLVKELVPHIENSCRVIPDRENRIIAGFSMGGYGAIRFAFTYPELFSLCISMDGAIHTLRTFKAMREDLFKEIFNRQDDYFNARCIYEIAQKNAGSIKKKTDLFLLAGVLETFSDRFVRRMNAQNIPIPASQYIKTGCDHSVDCLLEKEGTRLFSWLGNHFTGF